MNSPAMVWVGYILIALNVAIVGLLIWRKRFGCYSARDRLAIAQEVVPLVVKILIRDAYAARQADVLRELDELQRGHRNGREVDPKDYEEDCA